MTQNKQEPSLESELWLAKEVMPLVTGYILHAPCDEMPVEHVIQAWAILDFLEKKIGDRKAELRLRLLRDAEANGKPTDKGGQRLFIDGSTVLREKRIAKAPNEQLVRKMLAEATLKIEDAYDEKVTYVLNPSKVNMLVDTGKMDGDALEESRKVSWALKVFSSPELQEVLGAATEKFAKGLQDHTVEPSRPRRPPQ